MSRRASGDIAAAAADTEDDGGGPPPPPPSDVGAAAVDDDPIDGPLARFDAVIEDFMPWKLCEK